MRYTNTGIGNDPALEIEQLDIPVVVAHAGGASVSPGTAQFRAGLAPRSLDGSASPNAPLPRFLESFTPSIGVTIAPCAMPNLQASIRAKADGPGIGQRTWTIRLTNTGGAQAAGAAVASITTTVTSGPGPVSVATATPVAYGDISSAGFKDMPVVLNFPLTVPETWISIRFAVSSNSGSYTAIRQINNQRR